MSPSKGTYINVFLLYIKCQLYISKRSIKHKLKIIIQHERNESKIEKGSEEDGTGRLWRCQDKLRNFICNKENSVGRCEYIMNDFSDMVTQGHTELFTKSLKSVYYICGILFQNDGRNVKYAVKNFRIQRCLSQQS